MILVWNSSYEHVPGKRCRAWWGLEGMFAVGRGGGGGGGEASIDNDCSYNNVNPWNMGITGWPE